MPRYASQRNWPDANFAMPDFPAVVTGSILTLFTGGGVLLIMFHANIRNDSAALSIMTLRARLDGADVPNATVQARLAAGTTTQLTGIALIEAAAGTHTLNVTAQSETDSGEKVIPTSGNLIVIELPSWTTEDTIE